MNNNHTTDILYDVHDHNETKWYLYKPSELTLIIITPIECMYVFVGFVSYTE